MRASGLFERLSCQEETPFWISMEGGRPGRWVIAAAYSLGLFPPAATLQIISSFVMLILVPIDLFSILYP
jgi:hypothetical protein